MKTIVLTVFGLLAVMPAGADETGILFQSDEPLNVIIRGPFQTIMTERSVETEEPGTLVLLGDDGQNQEFNIQLRSRGNFRRREEVCEFTPLRINFRKSEVKESVFAGQDKLKLVTHCEARDKRYSDGILREYLAYRIFNTMTPYSFRVRLLNVRYEDTSTAIRDEEEFAFLIEDTDRLARRIDQDVYQTDRVSTRQLNPEHLQLNSLFQYLIGNTDFSPISSVDETSCCHNHRLFGDPEVGLYSIPYDFDMSGIVNAEHALPNPRFKLRSVTQRLYRGRCLNNPIVPATIKRFQDERDAIYALVENESGLSKWAKHITREYIEGFYKVIDNPKRVKSRIIGDCI